MSNTRCAKPGSGVVSGRAIDRIKVTLRGSRPPIWRRLGACINKGPPVRGWWSRTVTVGEALTASVFG